MLHLRQLVAPLAVVVALASVLRAAPPQVPAPALTADGVFQMAKVWTVHLTFTEEAWNGLVPAPPQVIPVPTRPGFVAAEGKRNGISGFRGLEFQYVKADIEFEDQRFPNVAVRLKGNGTFPPGQRWNKPSLKVDLNKFVKGQKLAGLSTINLHNNITDASMMNEVLAYRLYRDAGVAAPRTSYARVYVTVPNKPARTYLGLYSLVENVDTNFAQAHFKVEGGAIFKPVTMQLFEHVGNDWAAYNQMYDPKTDLTPADKQRVIELADLVWNADDATFTSRIADFVDMPSFANYMAVMVWMANPDTLLRQGQNYYMHLHPTTRKFVFIPWDQDHSWGQFVPFTTPEYQQTLDILHPWSRGLGPAMAAEDPGNRLLERMYRLDAFRKPYLAELSRLTKTVTQPARLVKNFDDLAAALAPIAAQEPVPERVTGFKEAQGTVPFKRPINAAITVVPAKTFITARHASVVAQLKAQGIQ